MDTPLPPDGPRRRSGEQRARKRRRPPLIPPGTLSHWAPVIVFGLIALLAPLLFGAVDRIVQIGLVVLLAVGMVLRPPALVPLSHRANIIIAALLATLVLKEFAPWQWFGSAQWRSELTSESVDYGIVLPNTHNPEPQRALDALLAGVIGLVWFQWVRTLASERGARRVMGWALFGAGVAVAVVCFAMGRSEVSAEGGLIYGQRFATSWAGWGPFPNRNHTASFLAMSFLVGTGCVAWAILKRRTSLIVTGSLGLLLVGAALLASRSRGGLVVAFGVGLLVLATFVLVRFFSARTLVLVVTGGVLVLTAVLLFGGDVVARFQSQESGTVSNNLRVEIWKDTVRMWKDAPLFGHGLETFRQLFPIYQTMKLDGATALHPESSWLAWLAELGVIPLAVAVFAVVIFAATNLKAVAERRGGFFISIGALAGFVGFLAHCAVDVPAHRWATAGFSLALLAVACPVRSPDVPVPPSSRLSAAVPVMVAIFWMLPVAGLGPAWSPLQPLLLLEREFWYTNGGTAARPPRPSLEEWRAVAAHFPLDWEVQQNTGMRELEHEVPLAQNGAPLAQSWQRRFAAVSRLAPGLYGESMKQAYAAAQISKGLAIGYWQEVVDKAQFQKTEMLRAAVRETSGFPNSGGVWETFASERPMLLLPYSALLIEEYQRSHNDTRPLFLAWWEQRALTAELHNEEREIFNRYGAHWASLEQIELWIKRNAARRKKDYRQWAALLHEFGDDARAWEILSGVEKEPSAIDIPLRATIATLREQLRVTPNNMSSAAALVGALEKAGNTDEARELVFSTAQLPNAPKWFLQKAAFALAAEGKPKDAVKLVLRVK